MTRKSRRELEKAIDRLRADDDGVPIVMERSEAEEAGHPIHCEAGGDGGLYRNKFCDPPDPADSEDLVLAAVPPENVTARFADRDSEAEH